MGGGIISQTYIVYYDILNLLYRILHFDDFYSQVGVIRLVQLPLYGDSRLLLYSHIITRNNR